MSLHPREAAATLSNHDLIHAYCESAQEQKIGVDYYLAQECAQRGLSKAAESELARRRAA